MRELAFMIFQDFLASAAVHEQTTVSFLTFSIFGAVYGMQSSLRMMRAWVTETAREVGEGKQASFSSSLHSWGSRIRIVSRPVGNVRFYVGQRSRQNSFT